LLQSHQSFATRGFLRVVKRTSRSLGAEDEASAHHQGRVRGRQFDRRHSWAFYPSQVYSRCGWRDVSAAPGLHAVRRIARRDNFRRGIVRRSRLRAFSYHEKERYLKRQAIMSFSVQLPGFTPSIDPPAPDFSPRRAILPWALPLSGFSDPDQRDNRAGTTPRGSSASGNRFRPLSAHGFYDKATNEMIAGRD